MRRRPASPGDWTLRHRLLASLALCTAALVAATALAAAGSLRLAREQSRVNGTIFEATRSSATLDSSYLDMETSVRGYLLSGSDAYLDPYAEGTAGVTREVRRLRELLAGEPDLLADLEDVVAAGASWRQDFAVPAQAAADAGTAVTDAQQDAGKELFDTLRAAEDGLDAALLRERSAGLERVRAGRRLLLASVALLGALVLVSMLVVLLVLRRTVLDPLDAIRADVRAVAGGDLDHPVRPQGPPELRHLAGDVEGMRTRLAAEVAGAHRARELVERQRRELQERSADLERSNAELEQFAYVASHDLQEPLRKVASFTELLQRRYAGRLDERADTYIGFAADGARRMQRLITDLLAFSRVGRTGTGREPVDLAAALDDALRSLSSAVEEAGAEVTVSGELPVVLGDRTLLTQLWQNLVGNAVKFRRPGVPPRVRIGCVAEDDGWRITVSDDGIGIAPEYAEKVFVVFQRLGRPEDHPGTGIGLALCRKIVEHHGGRIRVDTAAAATGPDGPGGATIELSLPALPGRADGEETP